MYIQSVFFLAECMFVQILAKQKKKFFAPSKHEHFCLVQNIEIIFMIGFLLCHIRKSFL